MATINNDINHSCQAGITVAGGTVSINSGTSTLGISTDAAATTISLGTGGAAKTVVLGSTDTTSTTTLQAGSGGVKLGAVAEGALVTSATSVISTVTGTAGHVLTANAAGTAPSFQAAAGGGITTIAGNSGSATGATVTFDGDNQGTTLFTGAGSTVSLTFEDANSNMILGTGTPSGIAGTNNTGYGTNVFGAATTGSVNAAFGIGSMSTGILTGTENSALGINSLQNLTSGSLNCAIGLSTLISLTTGSHNQGFGQQALIFLTTGNYNVGIGAFQVGLNYTGAESSNILIENIGVTGESNVMRLGTTGSGDHQVAKCFIAAVRGVTTDNVDALPVLVDSAGQFGTVSSSARYKDNIVDMADNNLMDLRPVNFTYKSDKNKKTQYGLIAEEVQDAFPDLVVYDAEGLPQSVHYENLPAILLHELQKQNKRIAALEAQLAQR